MSALNASAAIVSWQAPFDEGKDLSDAPMTFTVLVGLSLPLVEGEDDVRAITVGAAVRAVTVAGLESSTSFHATVIASNTIGSSSASAPSPAVTHDLPVGCGAESFWIGEGVEGVWSDASWSVAEPTAVSHAVVSWSASLGSVDEDVVPTLRVTSDAVASSLRLDSVEAMCVHGRPHPRIAS